jgi:glycosyltransferase involved in cell wall biosynthesis
MNTVALIFDNFGPYHLARLRAASCVCDLLAIEVARRSATYAWDSAREAGPFRRETLVGEGTSAGVSPGEISRRLTQVLDRSRPAVVVVPGWASPAAWAAMRWSVRHGVAMVCLSESTAWDEPPVGWKTALKQRLVRRFSSALVGGVRHRDYLVQLGMDPDRISFGYDAVDNDYFATHSDAVRARAATVRRDLGLPENYFLASARFVAKKNLPWLVDLYAAYRARAGATAWSLVLLGDGPLRPDLERRRDALGLRDHLVLPGFKQYADLPACYALAGAFIHASTVEPWGLVVNEAAASGLPLLVSDRCGCAPELVRDGVNGFTLNPLEALHLLGAQDAVEKLAKIADPAFPRAAFGAASRDLVNQWGPDRFARGLAQAVDLALSRPVPPPGAIDRALLGLLARR